MATAWGCVFDGKDCFNYRQWFFTNLLMLVVIGIGFGYSLHTTLASYRIYWRLQLYWNFSNIRLYKSSFIAMTMLQPNYCRNHDYNNDFNWTYKVKTNVYKCFVEARNEKIIGYMKPLKNLWDEIHSE